MSFRMLSQLSLVLSLSFTVLCHPESSSKADGTDTCGTVERAYPSIEIAYPFSAAYRATQTDYWNKACTKLSPSCILYPANANEVVKIIDVLSANQEGFAIKSGGHMPNCGFNSVERGPLIAMSKMKKIQYSMDKETAKVGPGNRWQDVAVELGKYGRSAVGGRIGHVGVPGLLLGGGLSFHSTQYGWASTHVLEYEVVLANGTIVKASKESHPDLHRALQAGGNQFGVVTSFTLRTFPQGPVWGGTRMYSGDKSTALLTAVRDFTEHYPDPKASLIATSQMTMWGSTNLWVLFFFYDGIRPPSHVFESFDKLTSVTDTTGPKQFVDLLYENNGVASINNTFLTMATETLPLPPGEGSLQRLNAVHTTWADSASKYSKIAGFTGMSTIAYQPVPQLISEATQKYGGNIMDMGKGNRLVLEYDCMYGYDDEAAESNADNTTREIYEGAKKVIQGFTQNRAQDDVYAPLFMNDAYRKQDYWSRFKERDFIKMVKREVDPGNFFGLRTSGWKL